MTHAPTSENPSSVRPRELSGDIVAAALTLAWLLIVRAALDCPWGFSVGTEPEGVRFAIPFNANDAWFYLSWVEQYRAGHWGAEILYTVAPHAALLWIFPLWLVGRIAALTGLPTLGVYNAAGAAGAVLAVFFFRRAAQLCGLGRSARDWATVAFVVGSGGSWLWFLAHRLGWAPPMNGGEFRFLDFFPSTAFLVYPYHTLGYALLAALWWGVSVAEDRLAGARASAVSLSLVAATAALLSLSRPYEPIAFAAAYAVRTACAWLRRARDPAGWRASRVTVVVLLAALAPGLGWNAYVALQPAWSVFAQHALALGLGRMGWLTAFGGLWILGAAGRLMAFGQPHGRGDLPVAAAVLGAVVLLGLGQSQVKLASGLILGVAALAGWGAARFVAWASARWHPALVVIIGAPLLGALLGVPSLFLGLRAIRLAPPSVATPEFLAVTRQIPALTGGHRTVVLTDARTGNLLPGLLGVRVLAGHDNVTSDYAAIEARLQQAGFDAARLPSDPAGVRASMPILLAAGADYALLDGRCAAARDALHRLGWTTVADTRTWILLRSSGSPGPAPARS